MVYALARCHPLTPDLVTAMAAGRAVRQGCALERAVGSSGIQVTAQLPAAVEIAVLNRFDRPPPMAGEAEVKYLDGDFRVLRPGAFVRCAVTGVPIPLEELKYWSVDLQEPYASPDAVLQRHFPDRLKQ
jgi:hypothetical protein